MTTSTITDERLVELERAAAAATPGPWRCDDEDELEGAILAEGTADGVHIAMVSTVADFPCLDEDDVDQTEQAGRECVANKTFIAASRTAVPALVAALRAELARVALLEGLLREARPVVQRTHERARYLGVDAFGALRDRIDAALNAKEAADE